jgi:hypothetical protein
METLLNRGPESAEMCHDGCATQDGDKSYVLCGCQNFGGMYCPFYTRKLLEVAFFIILVPSYHNMCCLVLEMCDPNTHFCENITSETLFVLFW